MISAFLLVILFCHSITFKAKFTTDDWINAKNENKYHYVDDLLDNYQLIGMPSEEVENLLGKHHISMNKDSIMYDSYVKAESDVDMIWYYRIEDHPLDGWRILLIKFKNNIVVDVEKSIEIAG